MGEYYNLKLYWQKKGTLIAHNACSSFWYKQMN
jgi:hypothetical protein